jgi:hypothetical protein
VEDFNFWEAPTELSRHAALKRAFAPEKALLIAAHAWDVHGKFQRRVSWHLDSTPRVAISPPDG